MTHKKINPSVKILYGVCGIGLGHTYRQLPIIEHFAKKATIVIFSYGESFDFYSRLYSGKKYPHIHVIRVAVPFIAGKKGGLDFHAAATHVTDSQSSELLKINFMAMNRAATLIGKPDIVISDYEPVSASYAYAFGAPLITIDQQSKYFFDEFGSEVADEVMRLRMFFPHAHARIACSFFKVGKKSTPAVNIFPPTIRDEIVHIKRNVAKQNNILVYFSSQQEMKQKLPTILSICEKQQATFHLFTHLPRALINSVANNIIVYPRGDTRFYDVLSTCSGIISTAGHTLLAEAMYLGIPVYAIYLPVFEQQMNAKKIAQGFGVCSDKLSPGKLRTFLKNIDLYAQNISKDKKILVRGCGQDKIIAFLEQTYLSD